ncbi:MAG TPA: hypothetical protein V6C58_06060 [Allocoleopsis sp.]
MTQITLNLPDDLISQLSYVKEQLPQIIALGLRELNASSQLGFKGSAEILEFLASLPTESEIIALRPNESLQQEINTLLAKSRLGKLTPKEEQQWEQYQYLEHLVRIAKAKAFIKLKQESNNE